MDSAVNHLTSDDAIRALGNNGALVVINHPNWLVPAHYSEAELFGLYRGADGIEIYNALIDRVPGAADATLKWDRILTEKGPILGFSSDDSHLESDIGKAYIMVNVQAANIEDLFSGVASGRFYCSTGVRILGIGRSGDEIYCVSDEDVQIDAIGENGQLFASARHELRCSLRDTDSAYLRFTLYGHAKQQAWSQPFFRTAQG